MSYGVEIRKSNGVLWMSPDVTPMNLVQRFQQSFVGRDDSPTIIIQLAVPANESCMVFTRSLTGGGVAYNMTQQNGYWALAINGAAGENGNNGSPTVNVIFYVFASMVLPPSRFSAAYYDANGIMRWHAEMRPLEVFQASADGVGGGTIDTSFIPAVSSKFSGMAVISMIPGTPPTYYWGSFAWRAYGTNMSSRPLSLWTTTSSAYTPWNNTSVYYINSQNYD